MRKNIKNVVFVLDCNLSDEDIIKRLEIERIRRVYSKFVITKEINGYLLWVHRHRVWNNKIITDNVCTDMLFYSKKGAIKYINEHHLISRINE